MRALETKIEFMGEISQRRLSSMSELVCPLG